LARTRRPAPGDATARAGPDLVLDRGAGTSLDRALRAWTGSPPLRILVGPEGGLEETELDACRAAGFRGVQLGPRNLRFETAAVCALAVAGQRVWSEDRSGKAPDPGDDEEVRDG
ncbi:MAG TPA: 16S rRNA (uracil(1498)-N(3))-methyltransferase, partial [Longimicrobiales bacterium]|nr:16S rRNA (uracil(1498)-N(3))-methyltransferase [Longimicrobiales bacterium]